MLCFYLSDKEKTEEEGWILGLELVICQFSDHISFMYFVFKSREPSFQEASICQDSLASH